MSNTFDPIEEETALSASPLLATIMADSISGTDVPIAKNVKPIRTEGMPAVEPTASIH